jgi:sigma-E factor negative regulatory protein RseC
MIEETAYVVKTDEEFAWVETQRRTTCGQCSAQKGCGTKVLSGVLGKKLTHIKTLNTVQAEPGDTVVIGLQESSLLKSAVMSYLLPLMLVLLGAVISAYMFESHNEVLTLAGAMAGFIISLSVLNRFAKKIKNNPAYQPVILRKIGMNLPDTFPF